ncbi:hypothetical protein BJX68DRAFT_268710 [Aspergillus pseudodeflectus]|uniref:Transcription factor domain-containing protein n=1 Tax=Aspergillus pseudodeflectus TaxID=176178 RepID=A0ABR4K1M4_9EURO
MTFPYLNPPNFNLILGDDPNTSQPTDDQRNEALEQSRKYWYKAAAIARHNQTVGLPPQAANPRFMLQHVPKPCVNPQETTSVTLGGSLDLSLAVEGRAHWKTEGPKDCGIADDKIREARIFPIGISQPTGFNFANRSFYYWKGAQGQKIPYHNYLAVLTLGWCYIMSARAVELFKKGARMEYTGSKAPLWENLRDCQISGVDVRIDICTTDGDIALWSSTILACSQGWRGILTSRSSKEQAREREFLTPWTLTGTAPVSFAIQGVGGLTANNPDQPLKAEEAFRALANFAHQYDLGDQFQVALTAAMTFPTHNFRRTIAQLPYPTRRSMRTPVLVQDQSVISKYWLEQFYDLSWYMTLSCDPDGLTSALSGMFWEPGVPRSLASVWLHPILREVPDEEEIRAKPGLFEELLAIVCRIRRPTIAALWLGAVVSGLGRAILDEVDKVRQVPDEVTSAWTRALQGFLDIPGSGPYLDQQTQTISRADVFRSSRVVPIAGNNNPDSLTPLSPWSPPGRVNKTSCAPRIILHSTCNRHHLRYCGWTWSKDGSGAPDTGLGLADTPRATQSEIDLAASVQPLDPPRWEFEDWIEEHEAEPFAEPTRPNSQSPTDLMDEVQFFPTLGEGETEEENLQWVRNYYTSDSGDGSGFDNDNHTEEDIDDQYVVVD